MQAFACGYAFALVVAGIVAASRFSDSEGVAVAGQTETAVRADRQRSAVGPVGPTTTTTTMVPSTSIAAPASTVTTIADAGAPTVTPSTAAVPTRLPPSDGGVTIEQGVGSTFPPPPPVVEYVPPVRVPLATAVGPPTTTCVPTGGDPYPTTAYVASMTMTWSDGHVENVTQVLTAAGRYDLRGDRGNVGSFQLRQLLPGFACDVLHSVWLEAWWG